MIDASNRSFNVAKQQIIHGLEKLTRFSNDMETKFPAYGFKQFTEKLGNLINIIQSTSGRCYSADQIDEVEKFSLHLSSNRNFISSYFSHQGFLPKLQEFWKLRQAIISTGKTGEIILWNLHTESSSRNDFSAVGDSIKRASRVSKITDNITNAILDERPKSILSIASILLVLIIRVEAHEYEIGNMLASAKKHINPFNYDTQEILSVKSKVQKGSGWRTDTRAIRDAVSHAKFTIDKRDGRYVIHFKNTEGGYNFEKIFTETDIMLFYQDYTRLIVIQTLLLNSALISDFLTKEFKK
jgi:hypothetical protein